MRDRDLRCTARGGVRRKGDGAGSTVGHPAQRSATIRDDGLYTPLGTVGARHGQVVVARRFT
jgi:hypothetical protein